MGQIAGWAVWVAAFVVTMVGLAGVIVAVVRPSLKWAAAAGLAPVVLAIGAGASGLVPTPPSVPLAAATWIGIAAIGVLGGGPFTVVVLGFASREVVATGAHGGILVRAEEGERLGPVLDAGETSEGADARHREILRGGSTIGYLERTALIGCVLLGQFGGVAVLVAVKGLGRFNELVNEVARERFIIGTLASLLWAGAASAAVLLTR